MRQIIVTFFYAWQNQRPKIQWKNKKQNKTDQKQKQNKTKQNKKQNNNGQSKDRASSTPLQIAGELVSFKVVRRSCFTSSNRRITLVQNPVKSHEKGREDGIVTPTNGTHPWLALTQIFHNGSPSQDGYLKIS